MAKDSEDSSKEGVDFEWVQGGDSADSGYKTRRFFTRAEKKARALASTSSSTPKASPKKAASASKLAPKTSPIPKARPKTADAKISVTRSPKTDNSMGGRLGRALGTFVGRQLSGPSKMDKLKAEATDQTNRSKANQGMKELMTGRKGAAAQYKSGGIVTKSGSTRPCKMC